MIIGIINKSEYGDAANNTPLEADKAEKGIPTGSKTAYDPTTDTKYDLAHELSHANDNDMGNNMESTEGTSNGIPDDEIRAVNFENRVRANDGSDQ